MKAQAPGKVVLSGAYAVLEGAPAIVSAVSRYVICDAERAADRITPEVLAALPAGPFPAFDASELREGGQKLGLGSSAAIVVASLAAVRGAEFEDDAALHRAIEGVALRAHQKAQGGGSGIDVAASTRGGTLIARRTGEGTLQIQELTPPRDLCIEAWASGVSASTPELLRAVARFRETRRREYDELMSALTAAAERAAAALSSARPDALIAELALQREVLARLGSAANVPIITPEVHELAEWAGRRGAAVLPSGAGGGDIVLWVCHQPSPSEFRELARNLGHRHIPLALHARGVFCFDRDDFARNKGVHRGS
jgi:phosphomevalonate kinase